MDDLTRAGLIAPASSTMLAHSGVAVAVRAGAPRPDVVPAMR